MPDSSILYVQAPDLNLSAVRLNFQDTEYPYYLSIELDNISKVKLNESIQNQGLLDDIQHLEVRSQNKKLFEGYDHMQFGTISKDLSLSANFIDNFINTDMCVVAKDW